MMGDYYFTSNVRAVLLSEGLPAIHEAIPSFAVYFPEGKFAGSLVENEISLLPDIFCGYNE